jgi:hypothetical protein
LRLFIDGVGHVLGSEALQEAPQGQGFGAAAKACAPHLRFAPARDSSGQPVAGEARISLRFRRS